MKLAKCRLFGTSRFYLSTLGHLLSAVRCRAHDDRLGCCSLERMGPYVLTFRRGFQDPDRALQDRGASAGDEED